LASQQTLEHIINGCIHANRESQKELYKKYFGLAIGICMRYCDTATVAEEIVNDSFLKIFKNISSYTKTYTSLEQSFLGWLKRIVINTAIDNYRKNNKVNNTLSLTAANFNLEISDNDLSVFDKMAYEEILQLVHSLSPSYRTVFNLYVIDGFKHEEIAKQLKISIGTSKSNLAKARVNIQKMLQKQNNTLYEQRRAI
jgi:RNA polymerase sigma factor (sigma-70 family)